MLVVEPKLYRPTEVDRPPWRCHESLPATRLETQNSFKELVQSMVQEDLRREGITDMLPALSQSDGTPEALGVLASTAA